MTEYMVSLKGCDGTNAFIVELDDRDAALLQRIARLSQDMSGFDCQPTMTVERVSASG